MLHLNPPIGNGPSDLVYTGQCFDGMVAAQVFRLIHITFAAKRSKWTACGTGRSLRRKGYPLSFNCSADRSHRSPPNWNPCVFFKLVAKSSLPSDRKVRKESKRQGVKDTWILGEIESNLAPVVHPAEKQDLPQTTVSEHLNR